MRSIAVGIAAAAAVLLCTWPAYAQGPQQQIPMPTPAPTPSVPLEGAGGSRMPVSPGQTEVLGAEGSGISSAAATTSVEEPIDPSKYVCGPGDVFELNFWGQQNFRLRIAADLEGRTFISKVGYVAVSGKTLTSVRADITKKVRMNYPGLQFDLTLVSPRTFVVHVADNVGKPGAYTAQPLERTSAVLARAGGVSGSRRRVTITRKDGKTLTADLLKYELTGDTTFNPFVLDGDVIRVPVVEMSVKLSGAVRRPGTYELVSSHDLAELLSLAEGFTPEVAKTLPIRVVRRNAKLQEEFVELQFGGNGEPPAAQLHDDDQVVVPSTGMLQRSVLLIGAVVGAEEVDAAATSKRLPYVEGDSVLTLIDRAGGITAPGDLSRAYISRPTRDHGATLMPIDLEALLVRRELSADKPIQMNDTIVVPPMRYSVSVEGAVSKPGLYNYNPHFRIGEYVSLAGGRTRTARELDESRLVDPNGRTHDYSSKLFPGPGDTIVVPERNFTRAELVQLAFAGAGLLLSTVALAYAVTR